MTTEPGTLAEVRREGDRTLVFVRELRHAPGRVWAALTDPGRLAEWAPYTADRDLGRVGPATLTMLDDDTTGPLDGAVAVADAPRVLEHAWGPDRLRWELEPVAGGTRLTLRHTTQDPAALSKLAAGWHLCLDVARRRLAGEPAPPIRGAAAMEHGWAELDAAYERELDG
jgi:uncharacterized protein YndB with AHSA1/START domain